MQDQPGSPDSALIIGDKCRQRCGNLPRGWPTERQFPLGGIGGAALFVPIVSSFFPFHIDFVRGAGLIIALSGSIAASPELLKKNLASFRLALPVALIASSSSVVGAMVGLALPAYIDETLLGAIILIFVVNPIHGMLAHFHLYREWEASLVREFAKD